MTFLLPGVDMTSPGGNNNSIYNSSAATQALVAATEAVIVGSQIVLPQGGLQIGSRFKWKLSMTKTAAGTGTTSILIKTNTGIVLAVGTTGGAATFATFAGDTETAAVDTAVWDIELVIRTINASTGTATGTLSAQNALAATGFFTVGVKAQTKAITAQNTSATVLSIGLAVTTGAGDVVTVNYVTAEASKTNVTGV